jgi:pyruvate-formate lyase
MGQIKNEQKQEDCPSCEGSGKITAAENNDGSAVMEAQMKKVDAIKALTTCPCSGFVAADAKELEAFSEERLTALAETFIAKKKTDDELKADKEKAEADVKAAQATITELKAAAEKVPTEDEYLAKAPDSIRTLVAEKKSQDAQTKKDLVAQLKTAANGAYTEDELNAKPITELMKLATMAKVQPADYSGRALPIRAAGEASSYTPPDPYAAALQARKTTVN